MSLPSLYALRAFCYAARHLSYTRAAQALCISQSAVSKHIARLEDHFSAPLFVRNGPSLTLTPFGHSLYRDLEAGFARIETACAKAETAPPVLKIKAAASISLYWLLPALERFGQQRPDLAVHVDSGFMSEDFVDFDTEPADAAVLCLDTPPSEELCCIRLFDETLQPVYTKEFARREGTEITDTRKFLHPTRDKKDWRQWAERYGLAFEENSSRTCLVFDTLAAAVTAASHHTGIALADKRFVPFLKAHYGMLADARSIATGSSYYLVWRKHAKYDETCRLLGDFLTESAV